VTIVKPYRDLVHVVVLRGGPRGCQAESHHPDADRDAGVDGHDGGVGRARGQGLLGNAPHVIGRNARSLDAIGWNARSSLMGCGVHYDGNAVNGRDAHDENNVDVADDGDDVDDEDDEDVVVAVGTLCTPPHRDRAPLAGCRCTLWRSC